MKCIEIEGQIDMFQPINSTSCSGCVCQECFHKMKGDCPEGSCYDDRRAKENSYQKAHHGDVRTAWSDWEKPGEQDHWCRGSIFYRQLYCANFIPYMGQQVKECLMANVSVYQDGSIRCCLVDTVGCEECYKRFLENQEEEDAA